MESNFSFKLSKFQGIRVYHWQPLILRANHVSQNAFFLYSVGTSEFAMQKKSDMRKMTLSKSMKKSRLRGQNFFLAQRFPFSPGGSRAARNFFQRGLQTSFPTQDFGRFEEIQCVPVCLCIRKSPPCQWLYQWLCPAYAIVLPPPHPNPSPPWSPVPCLNSRW